MTDLTLRFLAILALIAVAVTLIRGIKSFFLGGDLEAKRKSNKLMQLRIFLQFVAICVLMLVAYFSSK
jgi:predicted nucleic acid-binding Zn ribbon protein